MVLDGMLKLKSSKSVPIELATSFTVLASNVHLRAKEHQVKRHSVIFASRFDEGRFP
jgi:hypothetical protein